MRLLEGYRRGATPSTLHREALQLGFRLSYKAVHEALRRLVRRGVAWRPVRGLYALHPSVSRETVPVENFRAGRYRASSLDGRTLREALAEAWLSHLSSARPPSIDWMELYSLPRRSGPAERLWGLLRHLGLRELCIYWNKRLGRLKVETRWHSTPWPAHPASHDPILEAHKKALKAGLQAIREALGLG